MFIVQTMVKNRTTEFKKWQKDRLDGELKATYKAMSKESKRAVAIAKERATQQVY